jgi:SAM-dependent methyltransferase
MWLKNKKEPILEPIFRQLRFDVAEKDLKKKLNNSLTILDYGCGPEAKFYNYLKVKKIRFKKYFGIDPLIAKKKFPDFECYRSISELDEKVDLITMFAVLEHLPYPNFDFNPIITRLKVGGCLMLTTPTKLARPILEFLSYRLRIVSRREIEEHQHYYDIGEINQQFCAYKLMLVSNVFFEFGLNIFAIFKKM